MNIRFTSSLTPDDENAIAPALLDTVSRILDLLPIAYMIRIETSDAKTYEHVGSIEEPFATTQRVRLTRDRLHPAVPYVTHQV